jgi:hypothetical protein
VEEPFNRHRNLGNTADAATVKGLQLAVHYLIDHCSLELVCWPYQFPTSENPRPERRLPDIPPQYRLTRSTSQSTPRSPYQLHSNSFGVRQQYPVGRLHSNPSLPPRVPPSTPKNKSSAPGINQALPTPVNQLGIRSQVAYYIPSFTPNGVPLYVPYVEDRTWVGNEPSGTSERGERAEHYEQLSGQTLHARERRAKIFQGHSSV